MIKNTVKRSEINYLALIEKVKKEDKSPLFYRYYVSLFQEYYKNIPNTKILKLNEAGYLFYRSVIILDKIIDDKNVSDLKIMLFLQEKAIQKLSFLFNQKSIFWEKWETRKAEYFEAIEIENKLEYKNQIEFKKYIGLADKKSAFGKIAIDSLHSIKKCPEKTYKSLLESHKFFAVGMQLFDDVRDVKKDFLAHQFNWVIYEFSKKNNLSKFNEIELYNQVFKTGMAQLVLKKAISFFNKSISVLNKIGIESVWKREIINYSRGVDLFFEVANSYVLEMDAKQKFKKTKSNNSNFLNYNTIKDSVVKRGLSFIHKDFNKNFYELKHFRYVPSKSKIKAKGKIHITDIFQRAILYDCLADVEAKFSLDFSKFFKQEKLYIIKQRLKDNIGAWSYIKTIEEVAADIDDLAQIMLFFIRTKSTDLVKKYCSKAIDVSLKNRVHEDGGIETWIIPKDKLSPLQKKQIYFNTNEWGTGPDVEVVANFIYALHKYNAQQYRLIIEKAIGFIIAKQEDEGYWRSKWYVGNFYGTFICLKILIEFKEKYSNSINKAILYLKESQNEDGGYSFYGKRNENPNDSDSLTTAYALLSLKLVLQPDDILIQQSTKYLINQQNVAGNWEAINFIKPQRSEYYKSSVMTTAIVLKSLCT